MIIDFMTALQVILFRLTCPRDHRAKRVQFQLTCNLCPDSHKTQVWLCFLILSFLSTCSSAISKTEIRDLHSCLCELQDSIKKSDAMLYTPSIDDIEDNCKNEVLKCYILELSVIAFEEDDNPKRTCVEDFCGVLKCEILQDGCPCEIHSLKNSTIFYKSLKNFLEKLIAEMP